MSDLAPTLIRPTSVARRVALAVSGVAALGAAVVLLGPWAFALWFLPDVALLAGWQRGFAEHGRLAPRAVPLYNALHAFAGPVALTVAGVLVGPATLGLGVLWLSHVLLDRALGYGLRSRDGEQRG